MNTPDFDPSHLNFAFAFPLLVILNCSETYMFKLSSENANLSTYLYSSKLTGSAWAVTKNLNWWISFIQYDTIPLNCYTLSEQKTISNPASWPGGITYETGVDSQSSGWSKCIFTQMCYHKSLAIVKLLALYDLTNTFLKSIFKGPADIFYNYSPVNSSLQSLTSA